MNSEVEKEPSDFEVPRADDGYALPKFDEVQVLNDHKEFSESGETTPLTDIVPGSIGNKNQTSVASDQIEKSVSICFSGSLKRGPVDQSIPVTLDGVAIPTSEEVLHLGHKLRVVIGEELSALVDMVVDIGPEKTVVNIGVVPEAVDNCRGKRAVAVVGVLLVAIPARGDVDTSNMTIFGMMMMAGATVLIIMVIEASRIAHKFDFVPAGVEYVRFLEVTTVPPQTVLLPMSHQPVQRFVSTHTIPSEVTQITNIQDPSQTLNLSPPHRPAPEKNAMPPSQTTGQPPPQPLNQEQPPSQPRHQEQPPSQPRHQEQPPSQPRHQEQPPSQPRHQEQPSLHEEPPSSQEHLVFHGQPLRQPQDHPSMPQHILRPPGNALLPPPPEQHPISQLPKTRVHPLRDRNTVPFIYRNIRLNNPPMVPQDRSVLSQILCPPHVKFCQFHTAEGVQKEMPSTGAKDTEGGLEEREPCPRVRTPFNWAESEQLQGRGPNNELRSSSRAQALKFKAECFVSNPGAELKAQPSGPQPWELCSRNLTSPNWEKTNTPAAPVFGKVVFVAEGGGDSVLREVRVGWRKEIITDVQFARRILEFTLEGDQGYLVTSEKVELREVRNLLLARVRYHTRVSQLSPHDSEFLEPPTWEEEECKNSDQTDRLIVLKEREWIYPDDKSIVKKEKDWTMKVGNCNGGVQYEETLPEEEEDCGEGFEL
ncbi:unnamed protein product, partial [Cyprideis torosa]